MDPKNLILRGRIFDGTEQIRHGILSFSTEDGRILDVGERGSVEEPRGAKTVDVGEGTMLPGLIDSHVHFFGSSGEGVTDWATTPETLAALRSVSDLGKLLRAGFTSVRELGTKGGLQLSRAADEGAFPSPSVISCGRALAQTGGDDDPPSLPVELAQELASYTYFCDGPWDCRKAVRKLIRDGAGVVKFYASGTFSRGGTVRLNFTPQEMEAIADESHRGGLKVAAHAYGEEAILEAVSSGADSIEHGLGLTKKVATLMKRKGVFYVPTMVTYSGSGSYSNRSREILVKKHLSEDLAIAREQGVPVAMGSDIVGDSARPHGRNFEEIVAEAEFLGNQGALVAATSNAAACLGIKSGQLKQGYAADILVVRKNPLADIRALAPEGVAMVFKRGRAVV